MEVKVASPLSDRMRLLRSAVYQALLYARAVDLPMVEVWLYNYSSGDVDVRTYSVDELNAPDFFTTIEANLNKLASLRSFKAPDRIFYKPSENKIARVVRKFE